MGKSSANPHRRRATPIGSRNGGAASVGFVHRAPAASLPPENEPTVEPQHLSRDFGLPPHMKAPSLCRDAAPERSPRRGEVSHSPSGAQFLPPPLPPPPHPNWFFESFFHAAPSPRGGASRSRSWALPPSPESPRPIPAARSTAAPTAPASRPQPLQHVQGGGQRLPEQKRPRQRFSSQTQQVSAVLFVCRPSTTRDGGGGGRWRALGCCPVSTARRGSPRFAGRWWPWLWCPHFWWALSSGCGVSQGVQCLNMH